MEENVIIFEKILTLIHIVYAPEMRLCLQQNYEFIGNIRAI